MVRNRVTWKGRTNTPLLSVRRCAGPERHELKIDFGPGYRVYFGEDGASIILPIGGDKSSQASDIVKAKEYWRDYNA
jgi:putative addiction module killer protein